MGECVIAIDEFLCRKRRILLNVSVARAEIACNKLLIDYQEAVLHGKI